MDEKGVSYRKREASGYTGLGETRKERGEQVGALHGERREFEMFGR